MTPPPLDRIVKRIVALHDPDSVHLFGSHGKGTAGVSSDLDLLVVRQSDLPRHLRGRDITAALAEFAVDFDVLYVTPDELAADLRDRYSLLATIMPGAKLLYAR
jgi:predicted nucleotidyltransferase